MAEHSDPCRIAASLRNWTGNGSRVPVDSIPEGADLLPHGTELERKIAVAKEPMLCRTRRSEGQNGDPGPSKKCAPESLDARIVCSWKLKTKLRISKFF